MISYEVQLINELFTILEDKKKTGRLAFSKKDFTKFILTLQAVASLPRNSSNYKGDSLDKWMIPNVFKYWVGLNSVTISGSISDIDFLIRPSSVDESLTMDRVEMLDFVDCFFASFKLSTDGRTSSISSFKTDVLLSAAVPVSGFNNKCLALGDGVFPIELTVNFKRNSIYSEDINEVVRESFRRLVDKLD